MVNWYDTYCWKGPFTDTDLALEYENEIASSDCDSDCLAAGSKWSIIYSLNGATFLLISLNSIIGVFGVWYFWPRVIGFVCNCCLTCVLFAAIIVTGVFRYRNQGKLCALSTASTHIDESDNLTDKTTYESDGKQITALFTFELMVFIFFCVGGGWPVKPSGSYQEETPISDQLMHN